MKTKLNVVFNLLLLAAMLAGLGGGPALAAPVVENAAQEIQALVPLWSENFDSVTAPALPAGWAAVDVSGTSCDWVTRINTNHPSGGSPHSTPNLVFFNSYSCSSNYSTRLQRNVSFGPFAAGALVSFWMYHDTGYSSSNDRVQVQYSLDGGSTWNNIGAPITRYSSSTGWTQHTVDLTSIAGNPSVRLGFLGISSYGNDVHIDDVEVLAPGLIEIEPQSQTGSSCQGNSVEYYIYVTNLSPNPANFTLSVESTWPTELSQEAFTLPGNDSTNVLVTVDVPLYAFDGDVDLATITVVSSIDPVKPEQATIETHAGSVWLPVGSSGIPAKWPGFTVDPFGEFLYFGGLNNAGAPTSTFQVFTPFGGWLPLPSAPIAAFGGVSGTFFDGVQLLTFYAPGFTAGLVGSDDFYWISPLTMTWAPLPDLPEARGLAAGGITPTGEFIVVGGSPDAGFLPDTSVFVYSGGTSGTWSSGNELTGVGFTASGYTMVGDELYIGGNYFGIDAFYKYDVGDDTWTQLADQPASAGKISPLLVYDAMDIYLIGGGITPTQPQSTTWRYDIIADEWSEFVPLNQAVLGSGGGFVAGHLYTYGGGTGTGAISPAPHEFTILDCSAVTSGILSGTVTNGVTGEPIQGTRVEALGVGYPRLSGSAAASFCQAAGNSLQGAGTTPWTMTDAAGHYELTLYAPALYDVTASYGDIDPFTAEDVFVGYPGPTTQNFTLGPTDLSIDPTGFALELGWGEVSIEQLNITNDGYSSLHFEFQEIDGGGPILEQAPAPQKTELPSASALQSLATKAVTSPTSPYTAPEADVELIYDDGSQENGLVLRDQGTLIEFRAVLFNRFPSSSIDEFPFTLEQIDIHQDTAQLVGKNIQLLVYADPDGGSPANAILLYEEVVPVQTEVGWNSYILSEPVPVLAPADILIGFSTIYAAGGIPWPSGQRYPYPMDETDPDGQSWLAWMTTPADPVDPSDLTTFPNLMEMGSLGYPSDWMVRGYGSFGVVGGDIPWLSTSPVTGTVPMLGETTADVIFDAGAVTEYGTYTGTLVLKSDDPVLPSIDIPVSLTVTANPLASKLQGTVTTDRPSGPLEGATVDLEAASGWTASLTTDGAGYYETLILPADVGAIDVTVSSPGYLTDEQEVVVTAPGPVVHDVELVYNYPEIFVEPDSFEATVQWGDATSDVMDISNNGVASLDYNIDLAPMLFEEFESSFPPAGWSIVTHSGCDWMSTEETGNDNETGGTGFAADANSDWCYEGMNTELWTPALDLSKLTGATLTFNSDFNDLLNSDDGYVDVSLNGGATWTNLLHYAKADFRGPRLESIDLTPYTGSANTVIRFHYVAPGWDWWWEVDNVSVVPATPWLSWLPDSGSVAVEGTQPINVTMDSALTPAPGDYTLSMLVKSNDLLNPGVVVPATLHATANPNQGHLSGTVLGNRTLAGDNMPLEGATVHLWNASNDYTGLTDAAGAYEKYLLPLATGTYNVEISYPMYYDDIAQVVIGTGVSVVHDVTLELIGPILAADPEAIDETLSWGDSTAVVETLSNPLPANQNLLVDISEVSGSYTPSIPEVVTVQLPAIEAVPPTVANAAAFAMDSHTRASDTRDIVIDKLALGKIKVLIVSSDWPAAGDIGGLDTVLAAYPDVEVDIYPMDAIPTLDELLPYDVVLVGSQYTWESTYDHDALGDVFADYADAGGKVIQLFGTFHGAPNGVWYWALGGRWQAENYSPFTYSTYYNLYQARSLGVYQAGHPLMDGVSSIHDYFVYGGDVSLQAGAELVAYYDNGVPYLATFPGKVVAINQVLTNGADWDGDIPTLLHNALLYLFPADVPWLDESNTSFDLGIEAEESFDVTLDASVPEVTQPGTYSAWLWLDSNDPLQTGAYIPVNMDVQPDLTMGLIHGTVTLNRHASGDNVPAPKATVVLTSLSGEVTLKADELGKWGFYYMADVLPDDITVTASFPDYQDETITVNLADSQSVVVNQQLKLIAPWIASDPQSFDVTVRAGSSLVDQVVIENLGLEDLEFQFMEFPPTATMPVNGTMVNLAPETYNSEPLHVEESLLSQASAGGTVDFWVQLRQGVNLEVADTIENWSKRGEYVYQSLKTVADQSQAGIRAYLDRQGLTYTAHWINNSIFVQGGSLENIRYLATLPEVRLLRGEQYAQFEIGRDPISLLLQTYGPAAPSEIQWGGTAWGLEFINAPGVWDQYNVRGDGIVVANIDTGVQWDHPALIEQYRGSEGSVDHNYNWFAPTDAAENACPGAADAPCDWAGHGSHTMGTIVGDDGVAGDTGHRTGVAPQANWMACMGCDTPPNQCSNAALTACAEWIVAPTDLEGNNPDPDKRPNVVNNSWGGDGVDTWYQDYVIAWRAAGIFPAFSNGNEGPGCSTSGSPGDYPISFSSGAVDSAGEIADFSSRGPGLLEEDLKPDLAAPGVAVCSTIPGDGYSCGYSGTSMASPHTAGVVALLWSANPTLVGDMEKTFDVLHTTANMDTPDGTCGAPPENPGTGAPNYTFGHGYLDAFKAVEEAMVFDIPWLVITPTMGTVPVEDSQPLDFTFDATNLNPGVYTGTVILNHNDPLTERIKIPITMTVVTYDASLEPATAAATGAPGTIVKYDLTVNNLGTVADSFDVTWDGVWDITGPLVVGPITADGSITMSIFVTIPADTADGATDSATVTITSKGYPTVTASSVLTTTAVYINKFVYLPIVSK